MTELFFEPVVYLISEPMIMSNGVYDALSKEFPFSQQEWYMEDREKSGEGEKLCEFAGRMCYKSFGEKQGKRTTKEYMENIIRMGHGSVLEHANYSFLVCRASRGYTHQMVRHRAGFAFSQESTHFIEYDSDQVRFCLPGMKDLNEADIKLLNEELVGALTAYKIAIVCMDEALPEGSLRRKKSLTGTARNMLPIALESKLMFTANLRSLRHFVELRGAEDNTIEIREVAAQVVKIMKTRAPTVFGGYNIVAGKDGFRAVHCTEGKKV